MERKYVLGERLACKFSALTYHQKQRHWASGKFAVSFWGSVWTFVSEKGGRKRQWEGPEEERNTERVQMDAVVGHYQPRGSRKAFFPLWTLRGLGSQLYWNTILVPADTDNDGFKPPRFHCYVFCIREQVSLNWVGADKRLSSSPLPGFKAHLDFTPWRSIRLPLISIPCTECPHAL